MSLANLKLLDSDLAARAVVLKHLDLQLVLIDATKGVDKFIRLQGLRDGEEGEDFYCFSAWGNTGARGGQLSRKIWGPASLSAMQKQLAALVEEHTGRKLEEIKAGDRPLPGKYWLQKATAEEPQLRWEYYVDDGVDGKSEGWHPYEDEASEAVEQLYQEHVANQKEARTAQRIISSGHFSYKVDLKKMIQHNTETKKIRQIRRSSDLLEQPSKDKKAMKVKVAKTVKGMKAMKGKAGAKPMKAMKVKKTVLKKPAAVAKAGKVGKAKVTKEETVALGKGAKSKVWLGKKEKTSSGLKKCDLKKNMDGKLVSKKKSEAGRKAFARVACWIAACKQARSELGITGFVAVKKGSPLYNKARELYPTAKPHVLK